MVYDIRGGHIMHYAGSTLVVGLHITYRVHTKFSSIVLWQFALIMQVCDLLVRPHYANKRRFIFNYKSKAFKNLGISSARFSLKSGCSFSNHVVGHIFVKFLRQLQ